MVLGESAQDRSPRINGGASHDARIQGRASGAGPGCQNWSEVPELDARILLGNFSRE